jgi:hypothetical protein
MTSHWRQRRRRSGTNNWPRLPNAKPNGVVPDESAPVARAAKPSRSTGNGDLVRVLLGHDEEVSVRTECDLGRTRAAAAERSD